MRIQDTYLKVLPEPLRSNKLPLPIATRETQHDGHDSMMTSVRRAEHRGRKIEIHSTYRIFIDGEPLEMHTSVTNDGKVHCHSLPQYAFSSAVRMVKGMIDVLEIEEPPNEYLEASATQHYHVHIDDMES